MDYRRLGIAPPPGAMMFDQIGNDDHHDSVRIIHRALDAGMNFIATAGRDDIGAWLSADEADT